MFHICNPIPIKRLNNDVIVGSNQACRKKINKQETIIL